MSSSKAPLQPTANRDSLYRTVNTRIITLYLCLFAAATSYGFWQSATLPAKPAAAPTAFDPGCALPFAGTTGLSIDKTCGISGNAAANTPEGLQNEAKNNFCAAGSATTITPAILASLQSAAVTAKIPFGPNNLPTNRDALRKGLSAGGKTYREGQHVQMAAFFIETHIADLDKGESVNCKMINSRAGNDVHMALGMAYGADECASVTAELSPHFRPSAWSSLSEIPAKDKTTKPPAITQFPIRVNGQLFFDASHKPCSGGKAISGDPARQSLWEIHPVYEVDVCSFRTLAQCPADSSDPKMWIAIDKWKAPAGK